MLNGRAQAAVNKAIIFASVDEILIVSNSYSLRTKDNVWFELVNKWPKGLLTRVFESCSCSTG